MRYQLARQLTLTWTTNKNRVVQEQAKRIIKKQRNLKRTFTIQNNTLPSPSLPQKKKKKKKTNDDDDDDVFVKKVQVNSRDRLARAAKDYVGFVKALPVHPLRGKPHFIFPKVLKRWSYQNKSRRNMIFHVLLGKTIFLFPENMILPLEEKWKIIFLKKIQGNIMFSSNVLKRWSIQKGLHWDMICLVKIGRVIFFSWKHGIFSLDGKSEVVLLKKYTEKYFLCTHTGVTNVTPLPACQKTSKMILSRKDTPKADWHSRSTP